MGMDIVELWKTFNPLIAIGVMMSFVIIDTLHGIYALSVMANNRRRACGAAFVANTIMGLGIFTYVNNILYVLPVAMGASFGTFIAMTYFNPQRRGNTNG